MAKTNTRTSPAVRQASLALGETSDAPRTYVPFVMGPNPALPGFVAAHAEAFDPARDTYDVRAFDRDLIVNKFASPKAIYDMHSYWSKKHWSTIKEYIAHYLPRRHYAAGKGIVLDCFSGSGMTGVAALMENRPCVLVDASPAASFISHCYTHPADPEELRASYDQVLDHRYPKDLSDKLRKELGTEIGSLREELAWLYDTRCDRCGGAATLQHVVYSERFQCPSCAELVALFDCPEAKVPQKGSKAPKKKRVCPHCLTRNHGQATREFAISTRSKKFGPVPVLVKYTCAGDCSPADAERRHDDDRRSRKGKYFADYDLAKIAAIENAELPHWYPDGDLWAVLKYRLLHKKDFRPDAAKRFVDLYMKRTLWAYAAFVAALKQVRNSVVSVELLQCAQTALAFRLSRMTQYTPQYSFPLPIMSGTYFLPPICKEASVVEHLPKKVKKVLAANEAILQRAGGSEVCVSHDDARRLDLPENSVDYIFTDPAYVDKIQYGELNFIWEAWLGSDAGWLKNEIVVNPYRGKHLEQWDADLRLVLTSLYRALKPGRWMSLCYHDTDPGTWTRLQNMILDAGFEIHTVTVLDPQQKSTNQIVAEKVVKSDLVVNCLKPRAGSRADSKSSEVNLASERVREVLIDLLSQSGGQPREKLWDAVLKRLLARGQMAEHRFDDILGSIAFRSESGRWFLKEEFEALSDSDLKNEANAGEAMVRFARLRSLGVPALFASEIVLHAPQLADSADEGSIVRYIRANLAKENRKLSEKNELGGRLNGVEFYDCLFFYLTRWLKGRSAGTTPRRNLTEFLGEYLVRFKDGDKWLYRAPDNVEAQSLKKARQTGLGRRVRQFVAFVRGDGDFPKEKLPDAKTLVAWLKHCAAFGLAEEGVLLWEKGGLIGQLNHLSEDQRFDAEDYYAQCKRRAGKTVIDEEDDVEDKESEADEGADE